MRIPGRFNGPDGSANGGYASGAFACLLAPPEGAGVEVVLRRPPPVDVELHVQGRTLLAGDVVIAEAQPAEVLGEVPRASLEEAQDAQQRYLGFAEHAFPRCFTCGPERAAGDGLRIFPGSLGRAGAVAAVWEPHQGLVDADGQVDPAVLWAALDCPSGFAVIEQSGKPAVLGKLAVVRHAPVVPERRYVIVGWPRQGVGRRSLPAGSALMDEDGDVVAQASAVWVSVDVAVRVPGHNGLAPDEGV